MKGIYDDIYKEVCSEFFSDLRSKSKRTVRDVAYFLNLNTTTYYYYEKGMRSMPMSVFMDLCRFYNVDVYETFEEIGKEADKRYAKKVQK